ncbi:MAG: hypothetical protein JRE18_02070, partial [Deltaproteobacteria bacterium]|nr:hypothetical protein [Deltaproteobacteria bacterium]
MGYWAGCRRNPACIAICLARSRLTGWKSKTASPILPWVQLFHAGAYSHPMFVDGQQPIAPSAVYSRYSQTTPREMTVEDIHQVQEAFGRAAKRAKAAGFDGIEILASAGYLISQFLSPRTNQRTDAYGGNFENRVRFP